jgi:anthranilate synthase/aminodeoxychorismate synthase-like glutamine amidotransferase
MILMIDNYDSFTYNLYQYMGTINPHITVARNDKITLEEIAALQPTHIVLSPGPGRPENAGICVDLIRRFAGEIPILGVCLGHQAIGYAYGATVAHAPKLMHGKADTVRILTENPLLAGLPDSFAAGRYHSLAVFREGLPDELTVTAETGDGCVMALAHRTHHLYGVQFHPESVLTENGMQIIENFLKL